MNISSLAFLASPIARQIIDGIVPSAAVEQLMCARFDSSSPCIADLALADALAGLALLQHDAGESFLAACGDTEAGSEVIGLLRELSDLLRQP